MGHETVDRVDDPVLGVGYYVPEEKVLVRPIMRGNLLNDNSLSVNVTLSKKMFENEKDEESINLITLRPNIISNALNDGDTTFIKEVLEKRGLTWKNKPDTDTTTTTNEDVKEESEEDKSTTTNETNQ